MRKVKSAERVLALFELFSKVQTPLTVGQVAQELGIPQPSASMLLHHLVELGYLERNVTARTFSPTIRIVLLGSWIERKFIGTADVSRHLETLYRTVGEISYIAMQNGPYVQYILARIPSRPKSLYVRSGQLRPLVNSSIGRALLATKTNAEIVSWVKRCNAEVLVPTTQPTALNDDFYDTGVKFTREPVKISDFMKVIERTRAQGYAETAGEEVPGEGGLAITFSLPSETTRYGVAAGGLLSRIQRKRGLILDALYKFRESVTKG